MTYAKWKNNTSSFPVKYRSLTWNSIKVWSEENLKTFKKKGKKKELAALSNMAGLFGLTHAGMMATDETATKARVLRLKESVLVLFRELKESCLFLSTHRRRPTTLMLHFSAVYSLGFISLMFSLSSPEWLLLYDIDNLCNVLFHVKLFREPGRPLSVSVN